MLCPRSTVHTTYLYVANKSFKKYQVRDRRGHGQRTCVHHLPLPALFRHDGHHNRVRRNRGKVQQHCCSTSSSTTLDQDLVTMSRCNFYAYCIFSLLNTVVYCFPAGWLWGQHGFLKKLGVVDIAGSGGVHLVGGTSGNIFLRFPEFAYGKSIVVVLRSIRGRQDHRRSLGPLGHRRGPAHGQPHQRLHRPLHALVGVVGLQRGEHLR